MVKILLARHVAKKSPYYSVVVSDSRCPRDGKFIEQVGRYNPCSNPKLIELDMDKIDAWVAKGAQVSDTVSSLMKQVKDSA